MLDETRLSGKIKQAYIDVHAAGLDETGGLQMFCDKLAAVIVAEVKELEIVYQSGLTAPNGAVAGTLQHTVQ